MEAELSSSEEEGRSLIKQLANCNEGRRGKALKTLLKTWLPTQLTLSDDDMKKIWKGLFYCMWHADKARYQSQLIDRLAVLVTGIHLPMAIHYFSTFLLTMRREWSGIDVLRLDKFYLLIRRFIGSLFGLMSNNEWELELVRRLMVVLDENTFFAEDKFPGRGVNYHIGSLFLEELRPFLPLRKEVVEVLLVGFIRVMAKADDRVLVAKIKGSLFDVLIENGKSLLEAKKLGKEVDSGDDVMVYGSIAVTLGFSSRFHEMGESEECVQGNRKVLFGLDEEFLKLEKEVEASVIDVSIPEVVRNGDEVVPPIAGEDVGVANGSAGKALKKCKKGKKEAAAGDAGSDSKAEKKKKNKKKKKKKNKKKKDKDNEILESESEKNDADNENVSAAGENPDNEQVADGNDMILDDSAISNLQMQFEKIAAEEGMDHDVPSACDLPADSTNGAVSKKRKRVKKAEQEDTEGVTKAKSGEKSAKKVKFSMKNNLVWKPQSPLPPQDLRLPPSATPRGSALKQGVPPGPIREMPPPTKRVRVRAVKKTRKVIKRVRKIKSRSP